MSRGTACALVGKVGHDAEPAPAHHQPASALVESGRDLFAVASAQVGLAAAEGHQLAVPIEQFPVRSPLRARTSRVSSGKGLGVLGVGHLGAIADGVLPAPAFSARPGPARGPGGR